ncbi:transglutaminase family protein [Aquincola sp. S2]|uniref:Transglutaminase family protein n=1 Tax=Pseudaquabacterium terrae TaxID=2732868 RepID=A0ABX2EMV9_9BURK|nr:transglutaminase family protein [Aquabacterium terrae]NRF70020.1 transglutaminase family protein [Aquabacterium terrae]
MSDSDTEGRVLSVRHETLYDYDAPVEVAHHSAHLRPRDTECQDVFDWDLAIDPEPEGGLGAMQESRDAFGNWRHGFNHATVHERLAVVSSFKVRLTAPPALEPSPPWQDVAQALHFRAGATQPEAIEFALGSTFAPVHPALAEFGEGLFDADQPLLDVAQALMSRVYERIVYQPNSTDVATDALQALAQGRGVCQDFAHLMIGALRSRGLAARYVSGYLLTRPPEGQPRLVGADASHAWVSVWCPVNGWVALDPTNDIRVGVDHVTLAFGRDYLDVAPLRGVIRGGGTTPPAVAVTVEPLP